MYKVWVEEKMNKSDGYLLFVKCINSYNCLCEEFFKIDVSDCKKCVGEWFFFEGVK